MMKTHIAIATTNGLVMVQQLTEEDDDVMSLVCLGLTSKQLSVSAAYADFVKKGSGLIAKEFGPGGWIFRPISIPAIAGSCQCIWRITFMPKMNWVTVIRSRVMLYLLQLARSL
jgi:hypothetical protein